MNEERASLEFQQGAQQQELMNLSTDIESYEREAVELEEKIRILLAKQESVNMNLKSKRSQLEICEHSLDEIEANIQYIINKRDGIQFQTQTQTSSPIQTLTQETVQIVSYNNNNFPPQPPQPQSFFPQEQHQHQDQHQHQHQHQHQQQQQQQQQQFYSDYENEDKIQSQTQSDVNYNSNSNYNNSSNNSSNNSKLKLNKSNNNNNNNNNNKYAQLDLVPESQIPLRRKNSTGISTTTTIQKFFQSVSPPPANPNPNPSNPSDPIQSCLRNTFKLQNFRPNQLEIIKDTLNQKDLFVVMRTGGGKSLCYQIPAVLERGKKVTIVISPLISLIEDQVTQMNSFVRNSAAALSSGMGASAMNDVWKRVSDPSSGLCMLFATPERVSASNKMISEFEKLYRNKRIGRFVIDECHCCTDWGHDFRPDYAKLGNLKANFPSVPIIAVTATASENVRKDCEKILRISKPNMYRSPANRPNLHYKVLPKESAQKTLDSMVTYIQTQMANKSGIIYTFSKKNADEVAKALRGEGISARSYHSDVSPNDKSTILRQWMGNTLQVVVATIAFGMGINKSDVRFVLHHTLSKSMESYYQESGRAGRDGKEADCILYYSPGDVSKVSGMISGSKNASKAMKMFWPMVKFGESFADEEGCRLQIMYNLEEMTREQYKQRMDSHRETSEDAALGVKRTDLHGEGEKIAKLVHSLTMKERNSNSRKIELCTISGVVKLWRSTTGECKPDAALKLSVADGEHLVVQMILKTILKIAPVSNKYCTNSYVESGPKMNDLLDQSKTGKMEFTLLRKAKRKVTKKTSPSQSSIPATPRPKPKAKPKTTTKKKKRTDDEVIDLMSSDECDESDDRESEQVDSDSSSGDFVKKKSSPKKLKKKKRKAVVESSEEEEEEYDEEEYDDDEEEEEEEEEEFDCNLEAPPPPKNQPARKCITKNGTTAQAAARKRATEEENKENNDKRAKTSKNGGQGWIKKIPSTEQEDNWDDF